MILPPDCWTKPPDVVGRPLIVSEVSSMSAKIQMGQRPVTSEDLHEITDVFMNAIHSAFRDRVLDGRAVACAFLASALGVLRDLHVEDPKQIANAFLDAIDIQQVSPFSPSVQ